MVGRTSPEQAHGYETQHERYENPGNASVAPFGTSGGPDNSSQIRLNRATSSPSARGHPQP